MFQKLLLLLLFGAFLGSPIHAQTLRIATYNIRYDNRGDSLNPWKDRAPVIADLVRFHDFDIFGTQEGLYNQLQDLAGSLKEYTFFGAGRDDGKQAGEFSAIFYKKDKFDLLKSSTFWLSTTSDRPSKGWDAALPRVCTWGQFKDRASGRSFYVFNVHFDHRGQEARKESAALLLGRIKEMAGTTPVVLTGDFNFNQKNPNYELLAKSGLLKDTYELAPIRYAPNGTFNSFDIKSKHDNRIDHIFVTSAFKVGRYGILTDTYGGRFPSDHFPVLVELKY
ncbi:endonuclease/exonuclease/phosphatase family protein [Larkinella soli]|uniref:endonuclease/exonuclease/phosphatase family protein n=1 Tax=Larkinella soli TaxID=1770527 RepID=UPI000FFC6C25|nr:endonuclease/exonuclease/phosphatase family protein [Larkinella soli]